MKIEIDLNFVECGEDAYYETVGKAMRQEIENVVRAAVREQLKKDKGKIQKAALEAYTVAVKNLDVGEIVRAVVNKAAK